MPQQNGPDSSNVNNSIADYVESMSLDIGGSLKSIDLTLKGIVRQDGLMISQSSLKDLADIEQAAANRGNRRKDSTFDGRDVFNERTSRRDTRGSSGSGFDSRRLRKSFDKITDEMEDAFTSELKKGIFGKANPLQDALDQSIAGLKDKLNVKNTDELGQRIGKLLGEKVTNSMKETKFGQRLSKEMNSMNDFVSRNMSKAIDAFGDFLNTPGSKPGDILKKGRSAFSDLAKDASDTFGFKSSGTSTFAKITDVASGEVTDVVADVLTKPLGKAGTGLADAVGKAGGNVGQLASKAATAFPALGKLGAQAASVGTKALPALSGAATSLGAVGFPYLTVAIIGATILIDKLSETLGPTIEGFKSFGAGIKGAVQRNITSSQKINEERKKRAQADSEAIVKAADSVIRDSANKITDAWSSILPTVVSAQGYDKAGVQDLWSSYAARLKDEGLGAYVSSVDVMNQLQSVLNKGLSGAVAERFAYEATVLNKAMPTEDFFDYASTFASIAANAIKSGKSQEEALDYATTELQNFASNLLYANREIAGGFTTKLTGAASLFEDAAKIALASQGTGSITTISGVLTSVSGIVGAIAPDLADSIVSAVVDAATGGNSSEITALRSLANVGASNTAFLQALAKDPQRVFSNLFQNLARMQSMSSSNYMEVAEALSSVFGISRDAFARVDFNYLATAISNMDTASERLEDNMQLLKQGQTTTTDEQARMQQINEYMIDQGLAYVLDNDVARTIQEHMWDEQLNNALMENTFAVDLAGGALDLMTGISTTIKMISNLLNPVSWVQQAANLALTAVQSANQGENVKDILNAVRVGDGTASGTEKEMKYLTTLGKEFMLTGSGGILPGSSEYDPGGSYRTLIQSLGSRDRGGAGSAGAYYETALVTGTEAAAKATSEMWKQYSHEQRVYASLTTAPVAKAAVTVASTMKSAAQSAQSIGSSFAQSAKETAKATAATVVSAVKGSNSTAVGVKQIAEEFAEIEKRLGVIDQGLDDAMGLNDPYVIYIVAKTLDEHTEAVHKMLQTSAANAQSKENKQILKNATATASALKTALGSVLAGGVSADASKSIIQEAMKQSAAISDAIKQISSASAANATSNANMRARRSSSNAAAADDATAAAIAQAQADSEAFKASIATTQAAMAAGLEDATSQAAADSLSQSLTDSMSKYINAKSNSSFAFDTLRSEIRDQSDETLSTLIQEDQETLKELGKLTHRSFYSHAELTQLIEKNKEALNNGSFEAWIATLENRRLDSETGTYIKDYDIAQLLSQYNMTLDQLAGVYQQQEALKASASSKARDLHEIQFWEDMQHFATVDFPWYLREWERYYIQHEAYTAATNDAYMDAVKLKVEEKGELGDSVLAMARALTENNLWQEELGDKLKDPVLHTNVLLSKILLVTEAIMQQNNDTSIVSVPTALSSLGLGVTNY